MEHKKSWLVPALVAYGTVQELTQDPKRFGGNDGQVYSNPQTGEQAQMGSC